MTTRATPSLDQQHAAFVRQRFLAMPIAGTIAWAGIGVASLLLESDVARAWSVFIGTGMIFYLGLGIARVTGEDLMGKKKESPFFDRAFFAAIIMAVMVYSIAIPFFRADHTSLPHDAALSRDPDRDRRRLPGDDPRSREALPVGQRAATADGDVTTSTSWRLPSSTSGISSPSRARPSTRTPGSPFCVTMIA
jgi:hypothetical protein